MSNQKTAMAACSVRLSTVPFHPGSSRLWNDLVSSSFGSISSCGCRVGWPCLKSNLSMVPWRTSLTGTAIEKKLYVPVTRKVTANSVHFSPVLKHSKPAPRLGFQVFSLEIIQTAYFQRISGG